MIILDYPLPNPGWQYWYTISLPQDTGVYDIPVYAPRLISVEPSVLAWQTQTQLSVPELGTFIPVLLILMFLLSLPFMAEQAVTKKEKE